MRRIMSLRGVTLGVILSLASLLPLSAVAQVVVVQPYVQPGDGRVLTGTDVKVISWFTDQQPGGYIVEFQTPGGPMRTAKPAMIALDFPALATKAKKNAAKDDADKAKKDAVKQKKDKQEDKEAQAPLPPEKEQHFFKYTANLDGLPFNSDVRYRVKQGDRVIREATFKTRATADKATRCVLVGDMAQGSKEQNEIAYQISKEQPEFLMALGDIVYPTGRVNQYMEFFWHTYNNVTEAGPKTGAPLMASVPFYPVLGNHDVSAKLPAIPDAFAAYYFFSPPKSGPGDGPWATKLGADEAVAAKFRAQTADSYPNMDAYSFDYGAAHFLVLNDNKGMEFMAPAFQKWMKDDLMGTKAKWKFVCFHIPGFHSSFNHYPEQQTRPLQPLFEECGVDITFAGHVHNYQRTVPLKFVPDPMPAKKKGAAVDGQFTLDTAYDGVKNTKPNGVIHIVAGGGGASLYGPGLDETAPKLRKDYVGNFADYTAKMVADKHSFLVMDIAPDRLQLRALNENGEELDRFVLTK
jgi:acid phosphatase type 7